MPRTYVFNSPHPDGFFTTGVFMHAKLKREKARCYHFVDGKKIAGAPEHLSGDVTGLSGDIDDCDISNDDRKRSINVASLTEAS